MVALKERREILNIKTAKTTGPRLPVHLDLVSPNPSASQHIGIQSQFSSAATPSPTIHYYHDTCLSVNISRPP